MSHPSQRQYSRMLAARQRLIDVRNQRMDQLQRLRGFMRAQLGDFVSNVDPISGQRFADISADGNKARGEMSISVAFFEGTKLTIAMDSLARFSHTSTPGDLLGDVAKIVDVRVTADLTRAQLVVEGADGAPVRHIDLADVVDELIDLAVKSVEADLAETPPETAPARQGDTLRPRAAALNFSLH